MQQIEVEVNFGTIVPGTDTVAPEEFGAVQTGFTGFDGFDEQFQYLDLNTLRWPGGTLAEVQEDVYGLEVERLFDGTQLYNPNPDRVRPDLTDSLAYASENDLAFSMIVPTVRYADDIDQGVEDLEEFMADLLSGTYGPPPEDFTIEIGNEYAGQEPFANNPELYGQIANEFILVIEEAVNSPEINQIGADVNIAVQMGYTAEDDAAIRAQMSPEALVAIDSLVTHALPLNFEAVDKPETAASAHPEDFGESNWENRSDYFDAWVTAIEATGGHTEDLEFFVSAMTVGAAATDPSQVNLDYQDYGAQGASAYLELFSTLHANGMDAAAIWGVSVTNLNAVTYQTAEGMFVTPAGATIKLMADNIVGMYLVDGYQENTRDDAVMAYAFEDSEAAVIFLAANDIPSEGIEVLIDLEDLEGAVALEATRVMSVVDEVSEDVWSVSELMLCEEGALVEFEPQVIDGNVSITMTQDYEVVMLRIEKADYYGIESASFGSADNDVVEGYAGPDYIDGLSGNDVLNGGDGDDTILGGDGDDRIWGNAGIDYLDGEAGHDEIFGGAGGDEIRGGDGDDIIYGYADDDIISGDAGDDLIYGSDGNDILFGRYGNDRIDGSTGDDRIYGDAGRDVIFAEGGNDTVFGGDDPDWIYGGVGDDRLNGENGNDVVQGADGNDSVIGGLGNDTLSGGPGADKLLGGSGTDILQGDEGNDSLNGGSANDVLVGGLGNDVLTGASGADVFVFNESDFGNDVITDFEPGIDTIDLSGLGYAPDTFLSDHVFENAGSVVIEVDQGTVVLEGIGYDAVALGDFLLG